MRSLCFFFFLVIPLEVEAAGHFGMFFSPPNPILLGHKAANQTTSYTQNGDFIPSLSGLYQITVVGGGGGAGGIWTDTKWPGAAGGGGAGATAYYFAPLTSGVSYSIVVGAGGSGSCNGAYFNTDGGVSSFLNADQQITVTAGGGKKGSSYSEYTGNSGGLAGVTAQATYTGPAGAGEKGQDYNNGEGIVGGKGGDSSQGVGGSAGTGDYWTSEANADTPGNGKPLATAYGAGGGGGGARGDGLPLGTYVATCGGAGMQGVVIIKSLF